MAKKILRIVSGVLLVYVGLALIYSFGITDGPGAYRIEATKRLYAVTGGLLGLALGMWLLKTLSRKAMLTVVLVLLLLVTVTQIPLDTHVSGYGGCDIAPRVKRVSLLLGNTIQKAEEKQKGCYSNITYRLYIL